MTVTLGRNGRLAYVGRTSSFVQKRLEGTQVKEHAAQVIQVAFPDLSSCKISQEEPFGKRGGV